LIKTNYNLLWIIVFCWVRVCVCVWEGVCLGDKLLATAATLLVMVAAGVNVIYVGLVLQQVTLLQNITWIEKNSHLNNAFCRGRGLIASCYIRYDCTSRGHKEPVECICNVYSYMQYIYMCTIYLYTIPIHSCTFF
jgi:hypothetical protein